MKCLFIYAHLDDETILSYGTMLKLAKCNEISILIMCGQGRNVTTQENIKIQQKRIDAFYKNCQKFNCILCKHKDITLSNDIVKDEIRKHVNCISPDIVFSHLATDFHYEHRIVAEEVALACRKQKNSSVKAFYSAAAPNMMQAFSLQEAFKPNYFIDITDYIDQKQEALENYNMELPADSNDIRSAESILAQNRHYGRLMNTNYCEPY